MLLLMDAAFAFLMICCAVSDKHTRVIPNSLIGVLLCLSLFHLIAICAMGYSIFPYLKAIPLFFLCYMCWRRGMFGGGDVKQLTAICFYFGFWQTAIAFEVTLFAMLIDYTVSYDYVAAFSSAASSRTINCMISMKSSSTIFIDSETIESRSSMSTG